MKNILEHREGERGGGERWSKGSAKSKIFSASTHANCCQMGGLGMEEWERERAREKFVPSAKGNSCICEQRQGRRVEWGVCFLGVTVRAFGASGKR